MAEVVLDANVLVAMLDSSDSWARDASVLRRRLTGEGNTLVLLDFLVTEAVTVMGRRATQSSVLAAAFLERVGARDYDGAYDLTSAGLRAEAPREGLEAYLRAGVPGLASVDEASVDQVFGSPDRFCCSASLSGDLVRTRSDLVTDQFFLVLVEEEGGWRVLSVSRERPPACRDDGGD